MASLSGGPRRKAISRAKLAKYIDQEVAFIVIGIDVENDRFIASRKAAWNVSPAVCGPL